MSRGTDADVAKARAKGEQEVWPKWLIERARKMGSTRLEAILAAQG